MTTDQLIFAVVGGMGFGTFLAALIHGLITGWGGTATGQPRDTTLPSTNGPSPGTTNPEPQTVDSLAITAPEEPIPG